MSEDQINQIVNNEKLPYNVRYAMIRQIICESAKPEDHRMLLETVGHHLGGTLVKGHPNYWLFKDGRKAKFDLNPAPTKPVSKMAQAFIDAMNKA